MAAPSWEQQSGLLGQEPELGTRHSRDGTPGHRMSMKDVALELEPEQSPTWCFARWSSMSQPFCMARAPELWGREIHAPGQFSLLMLHCSYSWLMLPSLCRVGSGFGSHLLMIID